MMKLLMTLAFTIQILGTVAAPSAWAQNGNAELDRLFEEEKNAPPSGEAVSATVEVPKGVYVFSDNPDCGVRQPSLLDLGKSPEATKAVADLFGAKAAAVVVFISQANELLEDCGGGDLCRALRQAAGKEDKASCAAVCAHTPPGSRLNSIQLSNRSGAAEINVWSIDARAGVSNLSTGDWSGWRDVIAGRDSEGRIFACGTATNWDSDRPARKVLTIRYSPGLFSPRPR